MQRMKRMRLRRKLHALMLAALAACTGSAPAVTTTVDTSPLNRTDAVRSAFGAFYVMDYDAALQQFTQIAAAHPADPLATDFLLDATIFKELNRLDLLDTTFYANDGFLTGKHPVVEEPATRDRIKFLADKAIAQATTELAANNKDVDALYARAWARSLEATYIALVERSFPAALKLALGARNDDEEVLRDDPHYVDAQLVVGTYQYVVGALPLSFRILIGIAGISGNKDKGMAMLRSAAIDGVRTSIEARTCMMLFLRREAKYAEAESIADGLASQYPHDYLFQLELANLQKDAGQGPAAITRYQQVLERARAGDYFHNAHLELAYFGLGDTLRGQKMFEQSADAFRSAAAMPTTSLELRQRCLVAAGKSYDLLHDRARATASYQAALALGAETVQGQEARKLIRKPYANG